MSGFIGKFKLESQECFEEYLKAIGVGMAQRMLAKAATPTVSYALNGGEWTVVTTGMKDTTMKFKCGIEQEDDTPDGRKVKNIFKMDGDNKIVQTEQWKDKTAIYTREVSGDKLTVTITLDNIRCVRNYKRM